MSKKHIVERMRQRAADMKTPLTTVDAEKQVNEVFLALSRALEMDGRAVTIPGFGTFRRKFVDTKKHRNPKTGAAVIVAAHHKITFREPKRR